MTLLTVVGDGGIPSGPVIVCVPALGTSPRVWQPLLNELARDYRIVELALAGHPGSQGSSQSELTISAMASDIARLAAEAGWESYVVAGLSIGGAIALEVATMAPPGLDGIAVFCSAAKIGSEQAWRERAASVRAAGTGSLVSMAAGRWFAEGFAEKQPEAVGEILNDLLATDDEAYAQHCEALATWDAREAVSGIQVPCLVVSGEHDKATTPAEGSRVSEAIPSSTFFCIPGVAHLAPVEAPLVSAKLLGTFVSNLSRGESKSRVRGFATRREVLGDEHVDRAASAATPETAVFQDFITRYAWGEVWSRDVLDRRSRSIATLASLVAQGNEHELPMHIRAARRHGLSFDEIAEVFLHVAVYVGLPKANAALAVMRDIARVESDVNGES